jgi:hypothetical protein
MACSESLWIYCLHAIRDSRSRGMHIFPIRERWRFCQWVHTAMHAVAMPQSHTCPEMSTICPCCVEEWQALVLHGRPVVLSLAPAAGARVPRNCAARGVPAWEGIAANMPRPLHLMQHAFAGAAPASPWLIRMCQLVKHKTCKCFTTCQALENTPQS